MTAFAFGRLKTRNELKKKKSKSRLGIEANNKFKTRNEKLLKIANGHRLK